MEMSLVLCLPRELHLCRSSTAPYLKRWSETITLLTSKRASRQSSVHFFDISSSKSGPNVSCFSILTSCHSRVHFLNSSILTSKSASCHNGVQFLISHPATWLCTRRFSEPTYFSTRKTVFCGLATFSRNLLSTDSFSSVSCFSDSSLISPPLLHLSISQKFDF